MTSSTSKVHSLKAAIFHTMAFKLSLEINNNKITPKNLIFESPIYYYANKEEKKSHLSNTLVSISTDQK